MANVLRLYADTYKGISRPVWILSIVMFIHRSGLMVLPFLSIYLTTHLGYSKTVAAFTLVSFGLGAMVAARLGGYLADKINYHVVQFWSMLLGGVLLFTFLFTENIYAISILLFFTAAIGDAYRPANMASIGLLSKPENRTRGIALVRLSINLGLTIGPTVGGVLAEFVGFKWLFICDGITCIFAAFFYLFAIKPYRARLISSNKKVEQEGAETLKISEEKPEIDAGKNGMNWLMLAIFIWTVAFFQILHAIPKFFEEVLEMGKDVIGYLLAINGILIFATEMPIVKYFEKKKDKVPIMVVGTLMCGLGTAALIPGMSLYFLLPIFYLLFITYGEVLFLPFTTDLALALSTSKNRGRNMGKYTMAFAAAHVFAPLSLFLADAHGFAWVWGVSVGMYFLVAFMFGRFRQA